jgi:hypothetical protein
MPSSTSTRIPASRIDCHVWIWPEAADLRVQQVGSYLGYTGGHAGIVADATSFLIDGPAAQARG